MNIPVPWTIDIQPTAAPAVFQPSELTVQVNDQIHWANLDNVNKHWPGLVVKDVIQEKYFFPEPIDENEPSDTWTPKDPGTYTYRCSLHSHESPATIVVTAVPA